MIDILHLCATLMIGLYAGSLLTEAVILVPYWRRMEADEFFRLHGTLGPALLKYFAPLTTIAVILAIVAAFFGNEWKVAAGVLCGIALIIFFAYFKKANVSFANHSLQSGDLAAELSRWAAWHWLRTVIVIAALAASIMGS